MGRGGGGGGGGGGTQQRQLFWEILKLSKPHLILAATARSEVGSLNNEWRSVVALASLSPEEKMQCATDSCWGEDVGTRWWCFCIIGSTAMYNDEKWYLALVMCTVSMFSYNTLCQKLRDWGVWYVTYISDGNITTNKTQNE